MIMRFPLPALLLLLTGCAKTTFEDSGTKLARVIVRGAKLLRASDATETVVHYEPLRGIHQEYDADIYHTGPQKPGTKGNVVEVRCETGGYTKLQTLLRAHRGTKTNCTMSAIAGFIRLPATAVEHLRASYDQTLQRLGHPASSYEWSGYILATLLSYLDEHDIRLMKSPYDVLTAHLCQSRGATTFIFTPAHKGAYLSRLSPEQFSSDELRDYFNDFNASNEAEIGQAMLDGIASIRESLASLDADSVIVFSIG